MLIIPAIDLKDGCVVRLYKGEKDKQTVYSKDPREVAMLWVKEGAKLLHVVDLDGAFCGTPKNIKALEDIINAVKSESKEVKIEFGGGVRTKDTIKEIFDKGADRVVLGTAAFEDRSLLEKLVKEYQDKIIVSIDIKADNTVAIKGWTESAGQQSSLLSFAKYLSRIGLQRIIYTDIERDGTLLGSRQSLSATYLHNLNVLKKHHISVILAGGISSLEEIEWLGKALGDWGLEGVIIGKALYEEKFTLSEALKYAD